MPANGTDVVDLEPLDNAILMVIVQVGQASDGDHFLLCITIKYIAQDDSSPSISKLSGSSSLDHFFQTIDEWFRWRNKLDPVEIVFHVHVQGLHHLHIHNLIGDGGFKHIN